MKMDRQFHLQGAVSGKSIYNSYHKLLFLVMSLVSHKSEGHVHETHGHKTSSEHKEERQEGERKADGEGIQFKCSGGSLLIKCTS